MKDRYEEVLDLLRGQGIDPESADEYKEDCGDYEPPNPTGERFTWLNGRPEMDWDMPCTKYQNALLNEWKKLV
jgi:hypothetical protein